MSRDKDQIFKSNTLKFYLKFYVDTGPVTTPRSKAGGRIRVQVLRVQLLLEPLPSHTITEEVWSLDKNTGNC